MMKPYTTEEVVAKFGFDPVEAFPDLDFWCVEDQFLHINVPSQDPGIMPETPAFATWKSTIPTPDGHEHVFYPIQIEVKKERRSRSLVEAALAFLGLPRRSLVGLTESVLD